MQDFVRERAGTATLVALGAGLGVGLLIGIALRRPKADLEAGATVWQLKELGDACWSMLKVYFLKCFLSGSVFNHQDKRRGDFFVS